MSHWLIIILLIVGYALLAGLTGGIVERMGWDFDCSITCAIFCQVGFFIAIAGIIWKWVAGKRIFIK